MQTPEIGTVSESIELENLSGMSSARVSSDAVLGEVSASPLAADQEHSNTVTERNLYSETDL